METMWNILRQKHTYAAFTFEAKLRPCFKNMNDCVDSSPPNTTLPHLLPVVMLLHTTGEIILTIQLLATTLCFTISIHISTDSERRWEQYAAHTADYGLSVVAAQLEAARKFPSNLPLYERNARAALAVAPAPHQPHLHDLFRTEFHVKFLWGARGALAPRCERHARLTDILVTMADKYLTPSK